MTHEEMKEYIRRNVMQQGDYGAALLAPLLIEVIDNLHNEENPDVTELETKVDGIDKEVGTLKGQVATVKTKAEEAANNAQDALNAISKLPENTDEILTEFDNTFDNIEASVNKLQTAVNNFNAAVTALGKKAPVTLAIGSSDDVKAANLAKLQAVEQTFVADIDYGYGTGSWLPATGGNAYIITGNGDIAFYTISTEGEVTKTEEKDLQDIGKVSGEANYGNRLILNSDNNGNVEWLPWDVFLPSKSPGQSGALYSNAVGDLSWEAIPSYSAATKNILGLVKAGTNIGNVAADAELTTLITMFNTLLQQLRDAGILVS